LYIQNASTELALRKEKFAGGVAAAC
jgi:hypothetical protein